MLKSKVITLATALIASVVTASVAFGAKLPYPEQSNSVQNSPAKAEKVNVKGKIVDADGFPVIGAAVFVVENTTLGTITNENGVAAVKAQGWGAEETINDIMWVIK